MCEFHESTCNGFGDIWWTDNPIYFSSIDDITGCVLLSPCGVRMLCFPGSVSARMGGGPDQAVSMFIVNNYHNT